MTQEEYNRIKEYEKIEYNIDVLRNAISVLEANSVVASCWSATAKKNFIVDALSLCQDKLPDVFRAKMFELIAERDKI